MRIRLLALLGFLGVLGGMVNAGRPFNLTGGTVDQGTARVAFEDPYPPPTPRP